jgi:uncharacterized membrane protein
MNPIMERSRSNAPLSAPLAVVALLMGAYVAVFGTMAVRRHLNLHTHALDLGYTDQAVWNTLQGRPFRFSTYVDAAFRLDIPIQDFREPDILLGYHVEPILAPISLLYLLHDGPETLLWLQTIALGLGAIPVYLLAHLKYGMRHTPGGTRVLSYAPRWIPVAFVLIYLLTPSLEAANLSDFHAVALSPAFLLAAFYCSETDRPWGFVAFAFLAAMTKEEVGLLVSMMGLWMAVVRRRWALGLGVAAAGAGWSLVCLTVIMPHFSGLDSSAFLVRYGHFGDSPLGILRTATRQPELVVAWLRRPDVLRYLRDLWLSSGGLAILHPSSLLMALPSVGINALSGYPWMRSGGGHYSVTIVPFLVIAAIYGVDWAARRVDDQKLEWVVRLVLVSAGLVVAMVHHHQNGISPPSRRFVWEPIGEHARRAEPLLQRIRDLPPQVPISVSSNLYPHAGHRERVYLFPTVRDAGAILLDATGPGSPAPVGEQRMVVRDLIDYAQFGVADSDHGLLLLEREGDQYRLSPSFYDVFEAEGAGPQVPVGADVGGLLRLEGFDWDVRPVVRPELVVVITTYWRALVPLEQELRLVFYFWDEDERLVRIQPEERAVHWYPTWLWEPGTMVRVTLPALPVGDLPHVGVAVLRPGVTDRAIEGRVVPITAAHGRTLSLWEQDTVVELVRP